MDAPAGHDDHIRPEADELRRVGSQAFQIIGRPPFMRLRRPQPPSHAASPVAANPAGTVGSSASDISSVQLTPSSGAPHMPPLQASGRVAERFKAAVLKTARGASPSWVRIPPLPPLAMLKLFDTNTFLS